jgi:hypothetical protein
MRPHFLMGLVLVGLSGCSSKPYEVTKVSGKVTLDGKPLPKAWVTFAPMASKEKLNPGPTSAGLTDGEGRYSLIVDPETPGSVVGRSRIYITTILGDGTANDRDGGRDGGGPRIPPDKVPQKYNIKTELTFDVPPGGTDQANFDLKSR